MKIETFLDNRVSFRWKFATETLHFLHRFTYCEKKQDMISVMFLVL